MAKLLINPALILYDPEISKFRECSLDTTKKKCSKYAIEEIVVKGMPLKLIPERFAEHKRRPFNIIDEGTPSEEICYELYALIIGSTRFASEHSASYFEISLEREPDVQFIAREIESIKGQPIPGHPLTMGHITLTDHVTNVNKNRYITPTVNLYH